MKVRYRKGIANHPDPESCGGVREGATEALTGESAGQPLSREITQSGAPTLLSEAEGHTDEGATREPLKGPARSQTLSMHGNSLHGNWDISSVPAEKLAAGRSGKANGHTPDIDADEKSDACVVPMKDPNNDAASKPASAEGPEGRRAAKRNVEWSPTPRTQRRTRVSMGLDGVREAARAHRAAGKKVRFTALMHHITPQLLTDSFNQLKKSAAAGVDGVTWRDYEEGLVERIGKLWQAVQSGRYRALPSRRVFIPKADGKQRPLGIAAVEDKIVQQAVVTVLTPIYETDFLGFSYGFRPGRNQHQALDALWVGLHWKRVNWVLDADITAFFDTVDHDWMLRFLEHRIADRRVLRLIRKWLTAGVVENGKKADVTVGTPQGAVITPRTQKATSSSSDVSRCADRDRFLTCDVRSNMFASNVAIQRRREGPSLERCIRSARPRSRCCAGRGDADRRVRPVSTPSVSLLAGGAGHRASSADRRTERGHYPQGARRHRREAALARTRHGLDDRRCDLARCLGSTGPGAPAWLIASAAAKSTSSIALTVCWASSSSRSMTSWFPIAPAAPVDGCK